jgi:Polyketide cyclase / dehydrase and lipid transport
MPAVITASPAGWMSIPATTGACGRSGRYPVSVEEILDVEPGRRLAYTVLRGIPVRNYRAEVTLTPSPDGTLIRWGASWDRTIMGRLVYRSLRNLYPVIVAGLVKAAEASQS